MNLRRTAVYWPTLLIGIVVLAVPDIGRAAVIEANPSNYRNLLPSLNPGDTMVLAPGTYANGLPITNMGGTVGQPIVIRGPDDQSAVFTANNCCNTVQLDNVGFVSILNLTLDGAGTNGSFGVDSRGSCHDITIENLKIINYGADQQVVGISTKGPAWNWVIRRNTIIGAGTGLYLGNSDGSAPFVNGIIEYNVVLDTVGYNMQIKHQLARPTNVGLPTGDSRTIIRHNVWSKQNNASSGANARPNVLVGHFPLSGIGANDLYEIYGNFFHQNPVEALFQGEGNIALHDNLFVNASGDAVNIVPHNDKPRSVTVYHNTVVAAGNGVRVSGADAAYEQRIIANAVFAGSPVTGPNQQDNVTGSYSSAIDFLNAPMAPIGSLDLYPRPSKLSGAAVDLTQFAGLTDATKDFNVAARSGVFRGAYEGEGANTGWRLALAIKPSSAAAPAPTVNLAADPAMVAIQGSSTLAWSTANAGSCSATDGWTGSKAMSGSEVVGPLAKTTAFTLTCTGSGGSTSNSVTVAVASETPPPNVVLTASPTNITSGESAQLAWQSTEATDCSAAGGWSGSRPTNGTETVGPIRSTTLFSLTCTGPGGSTSDSAQVSVPAAPTLSFQADRTSIPIGQSATLTWSTTGATSCNATGAWSGNKSTSGSQSTGAVNAASTYLLACSGLGGSVEKQVTVSVVSGSESPPPSNGTKSGGGSTSPVVLLGLLSLVWLRRHQDRNSELLRHRTLN